MKKPKKRIRLNRPIPRDAELPSNELSPFNPGRAPKMVNKGRKPMSFDEFHRIGVPEYGDDPVAAPVAEDPRGFSTEPLPAPGPAPSHTSQDAWDTLINIYKDRPVEFTIDILGATPDPWQDAAMRKVARGERRLSVRAGHGVGKSAFCSWLVIWQLVCRFPQKTVVTAPTQGQLFDALFSEIKSWMRKLPPPILELFELQSERIIYKPKPDDSFVSAKTSSAERPEAMAGVHSAGWVLLIADEASAIPEQVYESAAGSMSGHNACTILISNPTRNTGLFFMTHHQLRADWNCMHVSCIGNARVSPDFVRQIAATYGEDSNQYRVRVLGEFSLREDDVLIAAELVDAAMNRDIELDPLAPLIYGLDISRFGDDRTVLCKRRGSVVVDIIWWQGADTMQTVGRVMAEARLDSPQEICLDSIGVGGGVGDRLREQGINAIDINVSEVTAMNPQCWKLRDDLWVQARDWLTTRAVALPKNERLRQDLVGPRYSFNSSGKLVVEPKASLKKRKLPSPDFADALCLTFGGTAGLVGGRAAQWRPGQALKRNLAGVV
jgi:phage terminase large subunit